jgi:alkylation response protein AidB-like acyl-CoA dehydrogenase
MAFVFSEEQDLLRRTVRELAEGPVAKAAVKADLDAQFPRGNVEQVAQMGLLGVLVDGDLGGAGADVQMLAIACEELGATCASTAAFVAMTNAWVTDLLARHASKEVREEWLPQVLSGQVLGSFAIHEDAVGADPFRLRTALHPREDAGEDDQGRGVLSGTKDLVLLSNTADLVVVAARERNSNGDRKVGLWLVPASREGMQWGSDDGKLGLRGLPTAPLYLVKVPVGPGDRLAEATKAAGVMRRARQVFNVGTAAAAVGAMRAALEGAVQFAQERVQFGSPIARYEAIQHKIAQMKVAVESSRSTVMHAAALLDKQEEAALAVETANIQTFETAREATRTAIRVHGGAGFMRDLPIERYARDVRTLAALGRSLEVSRSLVGMHELQLEQA